MERKRTNKAGGTFEEWDMRTSTDKKMYMCIFLSTFNGGEFFYTNFSLSLFINSTKYILSSMIFIKLRFIVLKS